MSEDNDGNDISKLVILTLGLAALGFFAYLIYKESKGYRMGGRIDGGQSLADDNSFQIERRLHRLEMNRMDGKNVNVRTLQPMQDEQYNEYLQTPDAPPIPRKVVSMNSSANVNKQNVVPNVHNLSKADQDKVRRLFFNML